jgi:hypothetical protein
MLTVTGSKYGFVHTRERPIQPDDCPPVVSGVGNTPLRFVEYTSETLKKVPGEHHALLMMPGGHTAPTDRLPPLTSVMLLTRPPGLRQ